MATETELFFLVLLVVLTFIVHLIIESTDSGRHRKNR